LGLEIGGYDVVVPSLIVGGVGKLLVVMGGFVNGGKCEKSPPGLHNFLLLITILYLFQHPLKSQ
jgi:hypothetical protein